MSSAVQKALTTVARRYVTRVQSEWIMDRMARMGETK